LSVHFQSTKKKNEEGDNSWHKILILIEAQFKVISIIERGKMILFGRTSPTIS
jgi:hypothetical protein